VVAIRSLASYEGPLERAIHRFKYRGWRCLAEPLAELLFESLALNPPAASMVIPVPLHSSRLRDRGYNQSALLARRLALALRLDCVERPLRRARATPPQVGQDRLRRFQNVDGAFAWTGKPLRGQPVLLLDDVITTGATLEACATALRAAGAGSISGLTLARVRL
jgi:ComF family protein